ncbi:GAF domain-containing protein [Amycolatopsis sp. NPDC051903]|uniref:GAF domain-containing sensor histidine kinase n=1 Tax=Amycolatopsis sp. NPDC051903 TaxID=3363936 RepID=UPI00379DBC9F
MDYLVDGGGLQAIDDALRPILDEIRELLAADVGLVVYEPRRSGPPHVVLSGTTGWSERFLPHEPVVANQPLPQREPASLVELEIRSKLRNHAVRLAACVVVPWRDAHGTGAVVVGTLGAPVCDPAQLGDEALRTHYRTTIARALRQARRSGAVQLGRQLRGAARLVAEAAVDGPDVPTVLSAVLTSARDLMRSEVAYLAVPDGGPGTFVFDQVLGIRTPAFRSLRVQLGQGLGGLARELGRPIRSANYAADARLQAAPVSETRDEGIISAMAVPVLVGREIAAVLYVGDRRMRAFTPVDEDLLEEFAGHASLGLRRRLSESRRLATVERSVREQVAYDLHDSVVRGLVTIGFEAEQAGFSATDPETASRLAAIARAAEACMARLRGELGTLVVGSHPGVVRASEVLERIDGLPDRGVPRVVELEGDDVPLVREVADALVRVGREAVANAEQHSGGSRLAVRVATTTARVVSLQVTDNGTFDAAALTPSSGHFGMRAMRSAVEELGGQLTVAPAPGHGTVVHTTIPVWPAPRTVPS